MIQVDKMLHWVDRGMGKRGRERGKRDGEVAKIERERVNDVGY